MLIWWRLFLFYSDIMRKKWLQVWFLTWCMPVLSYGTKFELISITSKIFTPKIPMKYSKNGQNFITFGNTWNVSFETCWTPCRKSHFSKWPGSNNTFLTDPFYKLELRSEKRTAQWNHFDERRNLSLTMVKKNRTPTFIVFAI